MDESLDRPDGHMIGSYINDLLYIKRITWSLFGPGQWVWVSIITS